VRCFAKPFTRPESTHPRTMEARLPSMFVGRRVLEVACGTGWWKPRGASFAREWLAIDLSPETIEGGPPQGDASCVRFETVAAYRFAELGDRRFDGVFAGWWWSPRAAGRLAGWLDAFHARLESGARVVMLDNSYDRIQRPGMRFVLSERSNGLFGLGDEAVDDVAGGLFPGHEPDPLPSPVRKRLDVAHHRSGWCRGRVAVDWRTVGPRRGLVVFARSRSGHGSARQLPRLDGRIAERAVWCVGPAAVKESAVEGVGLRGGQDAAPVVGVYRRLGRGEESRPDPAAGGAEREHGGETSSVRDSACGDDRYRRHRIDDAWDERERGNGSPDVAASFPPLRNHYVGTGGSGGPSLVGGTNRDEHDCPGVVRLADDIGCVTPEERDDLTPDARADASRSRWSQARPRLMPNGRSVRFRVSSTDVPISAGDVHVTGSIPSPPAFETAAAKAGVTAPPIGARTTGASMPTRSHSGVRTDRV
jgi:SAM-dependent methyltransferase